MFYLNNFRMDVNTNSGINNESNSEINNESNIESNTETNIKKLKKQIKDLKENNRKIKEELKKYINSEINNELNSESNTETNIKELKKQIKDLKESNRKMKQELKKYKEKNNSPTKPSPIFSKLFKLSSDLYEFIEKKLYKIRRTEIDPVTNFEKVRTFRYYSIVKIIMDFVKNNLEFDNQDNSF